MKRLTPVIALLFLGVGAKAQFLKLSDNVTVREREYTAVEGSPYYSKEWKPGSIKDKSGYVSENLMVRYDTYRDEVQFMRDGKTLVAATATVAEFQFTIVDSDKNEANILTFRNGFEVEGFSKESYFRIVYDGDAKILAKLKANYSEELVNNYGTNETVKRFERAQSDFLIINGSVIKLSKNRKDLLSHFGDYEEAMKDLVKRQKLNVKDDNDVIRIMAEFDSMVRAKG